MMTRRFAIAAAALLAATPSLFAAESPTTAPTAARAPTTREAELAKTELGDAYKALNKRYVEMFPKTADLADPARRATYAAEAIGVVRGRRAALAAFVADRPSYATGWNSYVDHCDAQLVVLGDAEAKARLESAAAGTGKEADRAARSLLWAKWLAAATDADAQAALVGQWQAMATAAPADNEVARVIIMAHGDAASPEVGDQLVEIIAPMTSAAAKGFTQKQIALTKRRLGEGQPMTLSGTTPDGKPFTTADWKGKVILVDFWAVWCGPCVAELPRVKKMYEAYHDKGFEVLGVSNDYGAAKPLIDYTTKNNLPWPQLFDAASAAEMKWNPITMSYGINSIPVMFLIDKNGVCRTVTAREDFETLIPKMLAE